MRCASLSNVRPCAASRPLWSLRHSRRSPRDCRVITGLMIRRMGGPVDAVREVKAVSSPPSARRWGVVLRRHGMRTDSQRTWRRGDDVMGWVVVVWEGGKWNTKADAEASLTEAVRPSGTREHRWDCWRTGLVDRADDHRRWCDRGRHAHLVSLPPVKHLSSPTACSRSAEGPRRREGEVGVLLTGLVIVTVSAGSVAAAAWGVHGNLPPGWTVASTPSPAALRTPRAGRSRPPPRVHGVRLRRRGTWPASARSTT